MSSTNIPTWLPIADIIVSAVSAIAALFAALAAKSAAQSALAGIREMKAARTQSVRPILNVTIEERFVRFFKGGDQENVDLPRSSRKPKLSITNIGVGSAIGIEIRVVIPDLSSNMPDKDFAQKAVDLLVSWGHNVRLDYDGVCFLPERGGFFTWLYPNEFQSMSSDLIEVCGPDKTVESDVLEQFSNQLAVIQIARWGAGISEPLTLDLPLTLSYSTLSGEQEKIPMSVRVYAYGVWDPGL
jgi:hypothetical protein